MHLQYTLREIFEKRPARRHSCSFLFSVFCDLHKNSCWCWVDNVFFFWNVNYKIWQDGVGKHRKASNAYNATLASVICLQKLYFNLLAWYAVSSLIILAITSNSYHSWLKKGSALLLIFARSRLCAYNFLPKKLSSTFLLKTCVTLR